MAAKTDIGKFKDQIENLIQIITRVSPNDLEIEKLKIKINLGLSANPRDFAKLFSAGSEEFANEILTGNDRYFIESSQKIDSAYDQVVNKLKATWKIIDDTDKEKVRRCFKLLVIISCMIAKNESVRAIINSHRNPTNPLLFD